jgi:hypothetical protein
MSHPTVPSQAKIQRGLTQVLGLVAELGDYNRAHPDARNETLTKVALQLKAHALALDKLLQPTPFSTDCSKISCASWSRPTPNSLRACARRSPTWSASTAPKTARRCAVPSPARS